MGVPPWSLRSIKGEPFLVGAFQFFQPELLGDITNERNRPMNCLFEQLVRRNRYPVDGLPDALPDGELARHRVPRMIFLGAKIPTAAVVLCQMF